MILNSGFYLKTNYEKMYDYLVTRQSAFLPKNFEKFSYPLLHIKDTYDGAKFLKLFQVQKSLYKINNVWVDEIEKFLESNTVELSLEEQYDKAIKLLSKANELLENYEPNDDGIVQFLFYLSIKMKDHLIQFTNIFQFVYWLVYHKWELFLAMKKNQENMTNKQFLKFKTLNLFELFELMYTFNYKLLDIFQKNGDIIYNNSQGILLSNITLLSMCNFVLNDYAKISNINNNVLEIDTYESIILGEPETLVKDTIFHSIREELNYE